MSVQLTPAQEKSFCNIGYVLFTHAKTEVVAILTKLGVPELAVIPAGIDLPHGNGVAATVAAPRLSGLDALAAHIGTITARGRQMQFKFAKALTALPTVDPFGRPFPTIEALMAGSSAQARKHFTNSGWPKVVVAGVTCYMQDDAGDSLYGGPIKAGDWRCWNGVVGKAAGYYLPSQIPQHLAKAGHPEAKVAEMLKADGVTLAQPVTTPAPAAAKGSRKASKAEAKA